MSLPLTDDLGVVQSVINGTPVVWNNGLGYDALGRLCLTATVSTSDAFIGGKRRDVQGRLVVANSTPAGQPWFYNAGWPSDKATGATIVQTGTPAPTEPRVAGVAIGPLGGVYVTSGAFSPLDLFKNGEPGFWYDPSDLSTMFQDSAGTIPMQPVGTVADQPVGLILDKSRGLVLGAELLESSLPSGTGWGGTASASADVITFSSAFQDRTNSTVCTPGKYYLFEFDYQLVTGNSSLSASFYNGDNGDSPGFIKPIVATTEVKHFSAYVRCGASPVDFGVQDRNASGFGQLRAYNFSVKEIAGNHLSQATSTARPFASARVSYANSNSVFFLARGRWVGGTTGNTLTENFYTSNSVSYAKIVPTSASNVKAAYHEIGITAGSIVSVHVISSGIRYLQFYDAGNASIGALVFDVQTNSFSTNSSGISCGSVLNADGSFRVYYYAANAGTYGISPCISGTPGSNYGNYAQVGNDVDAILLGGYNVTSGNTLQTYQRVNTDADYNAAGFPTYLKFDGVDDSLATASFAMNGTSKATVFSGYANGKTGSTGTQLEFSANYMNNNGSMALLVPSLSTSNVSFGSRGTLGAGEKDSPTAPAGGLEKRVLTAYQDFATLNDYGCDFIRANGIPMQNLIGVGNSDVGAGPFGTYPAYVGSRAGTANFMKGNIYSLILAGGEYDAQTIENAENWIDGKLHP